MGSKQPKQTTTTTRTEIPPEVRSELGFYQPFLRQAATRPYQPYTGQRITPQSADYWNFRNQLIGRPTYKARGIPAYAGETMEELVKGQSRFLEPNIAAARAGIEESYLRGMAPTTASRYAMAGAFGGSAHEEALRADQDQLLRRLSEAELGLRTDAENRRLQALGYVPGFVEAQRVDEMAALEDERARMMSGLGFAEQERAFQQQYLDQAYEDYLRQQEYPGQQADLYARGLSAISGGYGPGATATIAPQQRKSFLPGAIAGGLGGLAGAGAFGLGPLAVGGATALGPVGWGALGAGALGGAFL